MSALQAEVFEAFRAIDVPEGNALRAAAALTSALGKAQDETARGFDRRDADIETIRDDLAAIRSDVAAQRAETATKADLAGVKTDGQVIKVDVAILKWMTGFLLAMDVAILFKLFAH